MLTIITSGEHSQDMAATTPVYQVGLHVQICERMQGSWWSVLSFSTRIVNFLF